METIPRNNPCTKSCTERSATCHASCEKYKTYAAMKRGEREIRMVQSEAMGAFCEGAERKSGYRPQF